MFLRNVCSYKSYTVSYSRGRLLSSSKYATISNGFTILKLRGACWLNLYKEGRGSIRREDKQYYSFLLRPQRLRIPCSLITIDMVINVAGT
jgi:hypothetical protein